MRRAFGLVVMALLALVLTTSCGLSYDTGNGKIQSVEKITIDGDDAYVVKIEGFDENFLVTKEYIDPIPNMKVGDKATFMWSPLRPEKDGYVEIQSLTILLAPPTGSPPARRAG